MANDQPLRIALIGAGNRASTVYAPVLPHLGDWLDVVAVCDPVTEHGDALAEQLGAQSFQSIYELLDADLIEGALVVTPVPSHHSISSLLSERGIHHNVETSMAATLRACRGFRPDGFRCCCVPCRACSFSRPAGPMSADSRRRVACAFT